MSFRGRAAVSGRQESGWGLAFLAPNLLLFMLFVILPIVAGFGLSFYRWDLLADPEWVGLDNFQRIVTDPQAINAFRVTLVIVLGAGLPVVGLGFLLAIALNGALPGIRFLRTLYFFPIIISLVASAILWRWVFESQWGVLNWLLSVIGVSGPNWLNSTTWALPAVIIVLIWKNIPLAIILYLAALQDVSEDLYDAARADGAGLWARIRHVTWPSVRPTTLVVVVVTLIGLIFGSFDVVAVMTRGGPLGATDTLSFYMYEVAFRDLQMGYASALAIVSFVLIFGLTVILFTRQRTTERLG